jgi:hypothetical protein
MFEANTALAYRRFPQGLFAGSEDNLRALHSVLNVQ